MKMLLLMRHAKAAAAARGEGDKSRRLTPDGVLDATSIGRFLDSAGYRPDLALVSDARRTRETLDGICPGLRVQPQVVYEPRLYEADPDALLEEIRSQGGDAQVLVVIGHNPAIAELASILARRGAPSDLAALARGFPPGAVAVFSIRAESWAALISDAASLERFATPETAAAQER